MVHWPWAQLALIDVARVDTALSCCTKHFSMCLCQNRFKSHQQNTDALRWHKQKWYLWFCRLWSLQGSCVILDPFRDPFLDFLFTNLGNFNSICQKNYYFQVEKRREIFLANSIRHLQIFQKCVLQIPSRLKIVGDSRWYLVKDCSYNFGG